MNRLGRLAQLAGHIEDEQPFDGRRNETSALAG